MQNGEKVGARASCAAQYLSQWRGRFGTSIITLGYVFAEYSRQGRYVVSFCLALHSEFVLLLLVFFLLLCKK